MSVKLRWTSPPFKLCSSVRLLNYVNTFRQPQRTIPSARGPSSLFKRLVQPGPPMINIILSQRTDILMPAAFDPNIKGMFHRSEFTVLTARRSYLAHQNISF